MNVQIILIILILALFLTISSYKNNEIKKDDKLDIIKSNLSLIDSRANKIKFFSHPTEAYTLNKKEIHMCVHKPNGSYYSDNTLMYIALHELAHAVIPFDTSTHPPIFEHIFQQFIERAILLNLYNPSVPFPDEYCGKKLSYY